MAKTLRERERERERKKEKERKEEEKKTSFCCCCSRRRYCPIVLCLPATAVVGVDARKYAGDGSDFAVTKSSLW